MPRQPKSVFLKLSKFKSVLFFSFLILSLLCIYIGTMPLPERATPFGFGIDAPMTKYVFEQDNLSISYPKSWNLHLTPSGNHGDNDVMALITVPWHSAPQIIVSRRLFTSNDLSDVVSWKLKQLQTVGNYKTIFSAKLADEAVQEYTYNSQSLLGDLIIHCKDFYILQNSTGYVFSLCSYASDWEKLDDIFNKIIESVYVLE